VQADSIEGVTFGPAHDEPLYVGAAGSTSECFDELMDEVRLTNRSLQPTDIAANHELGRGTYCWKVRAEDIVANDTTSGTRSFTVFVPCCELPGDANGDGSVNVADLTDFVDFLFFGGSASVCPEEFDNNCDCSHNVFDLSYFVDFLFNGGPAPCDCHDCPRL
jgi:hypothetical protein